MLFGQKLTSNFLIKLLDKVLFNSIVLQINCLNGFTRG